MKDNTKIIFWIGAILILIIGLFTANKSFETADKSFIDIPYIIDPLFTVLGFIVIIFTIFFVTILIGIPFLKKEK
jgi:hypothetical protein